MITKKTLIRRARDSFINALGFAQVNRMRDFIRYYGQAGALCELITDYFDPTDDEINMLGELDDKCLDIYYTIKAVVEQ